MPSGGSRKHPTDCKCGSCPKVGRKKQERPTNANVAGRVLAQVRAEQLWYTLVELECNRLGIGKDGKLLPVKKADKTLDEQGKVIDGPDYQGRFSVIPLTGILRYLEDRAYGRPMENSTINHLHDKPIDMNVNISVSERLRIALEKADKRVAGRR